MKENMHALQKNLRVYKFQQKNSKNPGNLHKDQVAKTNKPKRIDVVV